MRMTSSFSPGFLSWPDAGKEIPMLNNSNRKSILRRILNHLTSVFHIVTKNLMSPFVFRDFGVAILRFYAMIFGKLSFIKLSLCKARKTSRWKALPLTGLPNFRERLKINLGGKSREIMKKKVLLCLFVFTVVSCSLVYSDYVSAQKRTRKVTQEEVTTPA